VDPAIFAYLQHLQPSSLLECSESPWRDLESFCQHAGIHYYYIAPQDILSSSRMTDLVIVHDLSGTATPAQHQLLGYMRNCLTKHIWLLLPEDADWPLQALTALGFRKDEDSLPPPAGTHAYTYDIDSYNHKRSWNNARFWANPENFHKFRW
jgi:hypothetical protein